MRRIVIAGVSVLVLASAGIAWATTSVTSPSKPPLQRSAHLTRYYATGPSIKYELDVGAVGLIGPIRFRLPAGADTYVATITVSFQYRTAGQARFFLTSAVTVGGKQRDVITPDARRLAASAQPTSTTVVFRAGLHAGVTYSLAMRADLHRADAQPTSMVTSRMLVDVQAWPAG